MEAYLDNSATTRCLESVKDIVVKTMMEDYGNPSSKHLRGVKAEQYLKESREVIAKTMKVNEKEIFFTSGGTESNNWAVIGAAMANKRAGMHVITTAIEHPAVIQPMQFLAEQGFRVSYIPVGRDGKADLDALENAICDETILISAMYVNNEVGAVQPLEEIAALIKKKRPGILFHVDAIQAYGKYRILPKKMGIDMLSVSAHKIHGPKGVGFLYVNEKVKIKPLILGGGQQKGMRSGTDNVPGIAGLGMAAKEAYTGFEEKISHLYRIKELFVKGVSEIPDTVINSPDGVLGAPQIVSVSFLGIRSEVLLHALEEKEIYVSSGSACSSNKKLPISTVLKEIGLEKDLLETTVRFSFSHFTTEEEIAYCLEELKKIVPVLRKYSRH
ncbi:cysteine desulfurase family protein [uncultured Robinsoniella sp.]|uniref:cysteine desulfurase family protein n=1 Tax=uncultured Robinsoniella sp. TaxID=904190 RepID=UPI00374FBDBA